MIQHRQVEAHGRALARVALGCNVSVLLSHHGVGYGQAEARSDLAVVFDAIERLENVRQVLGGNTLTAVGDLDDGIKPRIEIERARQVAQATVYGTRARDLLIHLADAQQVRDLRPDFPALLACEELASYRGVMVTAAGEPPYDFVSRFFAPRVGINEDPVTGSAHTLLTPYWSAILGKTEMLAYQASARGGEIGVRLAENGRVELTGDAVVVFKGELYV